MTALEKTAAKGPGESKKFAFARFAAIILAAQSTAALAGVLAAILVGRTEAVIWLGVVAATCAASLGLLSLGYVLGQSALDMILTKGVAAVEVARRQGP